MWSSPFRKREGLRTSRYNSTQMQECRDAQSAVGTRREASILTGRAGKDNTKRMAFDLSFENEPDL